MLDLKDWVNRRRVQLDMDLRSVAESSGIHFSTINRIENGLSDPTMDTVIKLLGALNTSPTELFNQLTDQTPAQSKGNGNDYPTKTDVLAFIQMTQKEPQQAAQILADCLNAIYRRLHETQPTPVTNFVEKEPFTASEVFRYLLPENEQPQPLFEVMFKYPRIQSRDIPVNAYLHGAALINQDLKAMTSLPLIQQPQKSGKKYDFKAEARLVEAARARFEANVRDVSRMRLREILFLDRFYAPNGEFFLMACSLTVEETAQEDSYLTDSGILLILMSRWLAALDLPPSPLIQKIRP